MLTSVSVPVEPELPEPVLPVPVPSVSVPVPVLSPPLVDASPEEDSASMVELDSVSESVAPPVAVSVSVDETPLVSPVVATP